MPKPVARLSSPAQLVAALPLQLGFWPTESLVLLCCHEPRGRVGLTMRVDLPGRPGEEEALVARVVHAVRTEEATRFVLAVWTDAADEADGDLAGAALVERLQAELADVVLTEAVLVRGGRLWSYLCRDPGCCPPEGTPVEAARGSDPVGLIAAEQVLRGRVVHPDRQALEAALAGPGPAAAVAAGQRCAQAATEPLTWAACLELWADAVERYRTPPVRLADDEVAALAVSLQDLALRDEVAAWPRHDVPVLLGVVEEVARRTPAPWDAAVCTLLAWLAYCKGGGPVVTIALERALQSDPAYSMAHLLQQALLSQVPPARLRRLTRSRRQRPAC